MKREKDLLPEETTDASHAFVEASFRLRVYYEDTDAGQVVYHASYLKFAERARTEWLRSFGTNHQTLREKDRLVFVVKKLSIDYVAPARLDDRLKVITSLTSIGGATLDMRQTIENEDSSKLLAVLDVKLATITPEGNVLRLPSWLRKAIETAKE